MRETDYTTDHTKFIKTVQKEEDSFKPFGTKIGEYARRRKTPAPGDAKGKGKASVDGEANHVRHALWENCVSKKALTDVGLFRKRRLEVCRYSASFVIYANNGKDCLTAALGCLLVFAHRVSWEEPSYL